MSEKWLPVGGWEGLYEVSDMGRVRSLPRMVRGGNGSMAMRGGRVLRTAVSRGYEHVSLSHGPDKTNVRIHVLVARAFIPPETVGLNVCHIDGNSMNNSASNLYWGTQKQNIGDKVRHGTDRFALKRGVCVHGHEYTPENTYLSSRNGSPTCKTCRREGMRNRRTAA